MEESNRKQTICLLSGGMDSTFAAYWAKNHPNLVPRHAVFFNYGQKGAGFEWRAAKLVADELGLEAHYYDVQSLATFLHGGIMQGESLPGNPRLKDDHGNAVTFVPGRNLLQLSLLSGLLYATDIKNIVGGWNAVDVDYPDCSAHFLESAATALTYALGSKDIYIHAPAIRLTKDEEIAKGNTWGVPWELTRSCYTEEYQACGKCDSCLVRARAFFANGMQDPAYKSTGQWRKVLRELVRHEYIPEDSVELTPGIKLSISPRPQADE